MSPKKNQCLKRWPAPQKRVKFSDLPSLVLKPVNLHAVAILTALIAATSEVFSK